MHNFLNSKLIPTKFILFLGFVVLAFPCNQFGQQEAAPNEEIKKYVTEKFGVTFPLMSKVIFD
jgi:glutathione peroxidase-family protein